MTVGVRHEVEGKENPCISVLCLSSNRIDHRLVGTTAIPIDSHVQLLDPFSFWPRRFACGYSISQRQHLAIAQWSRRLVA